MPRTLRRLATALALAAPLAPSPARADEAPPRDPAVAPAALGSNPTRTAIPPRGSSARGDAKSSAAPGWWLGPAGVAGALAVVVGLSLASRRFNLSLPLGAGGSGRDAGLMQVVGHARLGPKQSVYLLRVGRRVLILGAGPGGSPAALGEVTDPAELERLLPARGPARATPGVVARAGRPGAGFDHRIGDDE